MDIVGDEAWQSVRLAWRTERWLWLGFPLAIVAFAFWIGASGAAVTFLAGAALGTVPLDPWTGDTDLVVGLLALAWLVLPAAAATGLLHDLTTTERGALAIPYRFRHPLLLLVPPAVLLGAGAAALPFLGAAPSVQVLLVVGAVWFLVRTVAYAGRVYTLSLTHLGYAFAFLSSLALGLAALVAGARLAGRDALVTTVAAGLETRLGVDGLAGLVDGRLDVAGVAVPGPPAMAVAVPVGLSLVYVAVQLVASVVARLLKPTKRRPELRAGQRYPAFARPATGATADSTTTTAVGVNTDGSSPQAADAASAESAPSDPIEAHEDVDDDGDVGSADQSDSVDPLRHTRVYTPDDDAASVTPAALAADADGSQHCRSCGSTVDARAADGTCPDCGAAL